MLEYMANKIQFEPSTRPNAENYKVLKGTVYFSLLFPLLKSSLQFPLFRYFRISKLDDCFSIEPLIYYDCTMRGLRRGRGPV